MELDFKSASLKKIIVHYVGSKNNLEPVHYSANAQTLSAEDTEVIGSGFLNKFNNIVEWQQFTHATGLQFNEVYQYALSVLKDKDSFEEASVNIAKHLYESSTHPKVKGGELYVALFEGLPIEGRMHSALGLFKAEQKSFFLDVHQNEKDLQLNIKEGMDVNKMDKGCLIIFTHIDEGFDVLLFDNQNRGEEAAYWKEKFLGVAPQKNEFHQTSHLLSLTKQFVTDHLDSEYNLPKKEQIDLLTKSIDYFKSKEAFDIEEFQNEVFSDENIIDQFRSFGSRYTEKHSFDIASQFDISPQAVKKQSRIYKSVLKLDKNFHIYIHGNTDLIEKGTEDDGRKYYKIYYQDEA